MMTFLLLGHLFLALLVTDSVGQNCQGTLGNDGTCYQYSSTRRSWQDAYNDCRGKGGNMAAITTASRQATLQQLMVTYGAPSIWTGGKNFKNLWKWVQDGTLPKAQGCYTDDNMPRKRTISMLTPKKCIEACDQDSYIYAAVKDGTECFCGNSFGSYGPTRGCTIKCVGNDQQWCGGFNGYFAYNIYGTYGEWAYGQPNNYGGQQNCTCIDKYHSYKLVDETCSDKFKYICQITTNRCSGFDTYKVLNKCVYAGPNTLSWADARKDCQARNGDLLQVESADMAAALNTKLAGTPKGDKRWVGLTKGAWGWSTGESVVYTNWAGSTLPTTSGRCAKMASSSGYKWEDTSCSEQFNYFCQIGGPTPTLTPPPATTVASTTPMTTTTVKATITKSTTTKETSSTKATTTPKTTKITKPPSPTPISTAKQPQTQSTQGPVTNTPVIPSGPSSRKPTEPNSGASTADNSLTGFQIGVIILCIVVAVLLILIVFVFVLYKRAKGLSTINVDARAQAHTPDSDEIYNNETLRKVDTIGYASYFPITRENIYSSPPVGYNRIPGSVGTITSWKLSPNNYPKSILKVRTIDP